MVKKNHIRRLVDAEVMSSIEEQCASNDTQLLTVKNIAEKKSCIFYSKPVCLFKVEKKAIVKETKVAAPVAYLISLESEQEQQHGNANHNSN